jgi:hypothetical protein
MPDPDEGCAEINDGEGDIPLLKWVEEDSESEQFTLVQSRKKKKKHTQKLLENPVSLNLVRSQRIVPSVYRNKGTQENPVGPKSRKK